MDKLIKETFSDIGDNYNCHECGTILDWFCRVFGKGELYKCPFCGDFRFISDDEQGGDT